MKTINITIVAFLFILQAMSGAYADFLLALPDAVLFDLAVKNKVGGCGISTQAYACSLYAKSLQGSVYMGLPDLYGSGCVSTASGDCWGPPNTYLNYNDSPTPICTNSPIKNGANMIRIGIIKGYCSLSSC